MKHEQPWQHHRSSWKCDTFCVSIQGLHPSGEHLNTNAVPIQRLLQMQPSFPSFWRTHRYYLSWPHIFQDSLRARKRRKKERKWRHRVAWIITFASLGGRNRVIRVNHLVTQPGNAPKSRPSHLTFDAVNKVSPKDSHSKTTKAGSFEECRLWIETQQVCSVDKDWWPLN